MTRALTLAIHLVTVPASLLGGISVIPVALAQSSLQGVHAVRGVVTGTGGSPMPDAEVTLLTHPGGAARTATLTIRTAMDGTFSFAGLAAGPATLSVRRVGYRAHSVSIVIKGVSPLPALRIPLVAAVAELDTIRVEARERAAITDFRERKRIRRAGYFIERKEIEKRRAAYTSDLLRTVPSIIVRRSSRGGYLVRVRNCRPAIYIDGVQAINAELDEVTRPTDIEAMEVYSSWAGVPPQFSDRFGKSCGAILVWTRIR